MKNFIPKILLPGLLFMALALTAQSVSAQEVNDGKQISISQDKSLSVYPVPATTTAHIKIAAGLRTEIEKVEIVNITGRKVSEQKIADKNTGEIVFNNLGEMPKGIYMVVARDANGRILQSAKLLLNN